MQLTRKEFISTVITAAAGAAGAALLVACSSGDDDDDGGSANCVQNGTAVEIASNHGHSLTVPKADVMAGAAMTYNIQGTATHPHTVTISTGAFAMLAANQTAMTVSSTDAGHSHSITITCA